METTLNKYFWGVGPKNDRCLYEVKDMRTGAFRSLHTSGNVSAWSLGGSGWGTTFPEATLVDAYEYMVYKKHADEARKIWGHLSRAERHTIFRKTPSSEYPCGELQVTEEQECATQPPEILYEEDFEPGIWPTGQYLYTLDGKWEGTVIKKEVYEETVLYALQWDGIIKSFTEAELCDVFDLELEELDQRRKRSLKRRALSFLLVVFALAGTAGAVIASDTLFYEWCMAMYNNIQIQVEK